MAKYGSEVDLLPPFASLRSLKYRNVLLHEQQSLHLYDTVGLFSTGLYCAPGSLCVASMLRVNLRSEKVWGLTQRSAAGNQ